MIFMLVNFKAAIDEEEESSSSRAPLKVKGVEYCLEELIEKKCIFNQTLLCFFFLFVFCFYIVILDFAYIS